jgi:hypothetical protein
MKKFTSTMQTKALTCNDNARPLILLEILYNDTVCVCVCVLIPCVVCVSWASERERERRERVQLHANMCICTQGYIAL